MECISCESHDSFNRVVVNQLTGEEIGLYCKECESDEFGEILDDPTWHQDKGCAFCDNAGKFKLPKLECLIERDDGTPRLIEYMTVEEPVTLCTSHIEKLLVDVTLAELESQEQKESGRIEA